MYSIIHVSDGFLVNADVFAHRSLQLYEIDDYIRAWLFLYI